MVVINPNFERKLELGFCIVLYNGTAMKAISLKIRHCNGVWHIYCTSYLDSTYCRQERYNNTHHDCRLLRCTLVYNACHIYTHIRIRVKYYILQSAGGRRDRL